MVVGSGDYPADILFIGEAPGKSEDLLGEPFVGPSGRLLHRMLEDASKMSGQPIPSYFITNTILCRPYIEDEKDMNWLENREPTREEVLNCTPHILGIYRQVKPKVVVFVGKISEQYYKKEFSVSIRILHPAALLRQGGLSSPYYLTSVRNLSTAFKQVRRYES